MLAVSRAADQALADSRPTDALADLQAVDVPIFPRADQTAALGLSQDRVVFRQLQLARAAQQSGDERRAVTVLARVGDAILGQHGSTLERTLPLLDFPIISDLRALDAIPTADRLAIRAEPAHRHLAGYRTAVRIAQAGPRALAGRELMTVNLQTGTAGKPPPDVQVRIINDSLGDRRYMLAIVPLPSGLTVALQLDPDDLLSDLLASDTDHPLRVLDANGTVMAPRGMPAAPLWAQVPFGQLFPELRLAMVTTAADGPGPAWRMSQLAPIGLVAIMAIIAMAARLRADRQLHELWDRQQAFVNRVSHELKTPLAGVKVMADLIALGIVTDHTEVQQSAQRIITEVSRMEDRVNDVLRLARSPTITSREPLDLRVMARKLVEIWTPRFEQQGARLTATLERTAPVLGDRHIINDAIGNLLDNALKYLSEDRPGLVMVRTATSGKWVIIEVSDNGIGVPEAMRQAIFQRFTRVEGDGRGKAGGHGLGLAFVAEAVHGHGGKIECRDGIAGGARFVIRLRRS
ncbi:MAG: HAMP domain-containing histidine kinase [Oligoflexia bacterium]|nr:HAMP domain-containing histidine kinase [Oligoflexia bacterium]